MILAGDVSPIDVISHIPVLCEENQIPYCYVPSKTDLGGACGNRRSMTMLIVKPNEDYQDLFEECKTEIQNLPMPIQAMGFICKGEGGAVLMKCIICSSFRNVDV